MERGTKMDSTSEKMDYSKGTFMPPVDAVRKHDSPRLDEIGQEANFGESALNSEGKEKLYADSIWRAHSDEILEMYSERDPLNTGNSPDEDLENILSVLSPENPESYFGGGPLVSENLPDGELRDYAKVEKALTEIYDNHA